MFQVGVIHRQLGDLTKSIETYLNILKIFEATKDSAALASTLNSIANVYGEMGKYEESILNFKKARKIFELKDIKRDIANTDKSIAHIYFEMGDMENALENALNALSLAEEIEYSQLIGSALHILGEIHFQSNTDKGLDYFLKAKAVLDKTDFVKEKLAANRDLGLAYYQLRRFAEAKSLLADSFAEAEDKNILSEVKIIAAALAEIHATELDYSSAYQYRLKYEAANDTLFNIENVKSINLLQEQFESERKDKELVEQTLQIQQRTSQRNLSYFAGLGLLAIGSFFYYRNRKNQRLSATKIENLEKHQKLMALDYMVQGQEEERKRIAQDLHDGLGGILSSARLQMQKIEGEIKNLSNMNLFSRAEELIDHAHMEVRRISHDMMPGALIDLDLIDAVEDLVVKLRSESGIVIKVDDSTNGVELKDMQKVQLYRAIQEILSNTVSHSAANTAHISFVNTPNEMEIVISDDGKGFDIANAKRQGGIGLKNIESRIKYLNGQLEINSATNQGTQFKISIPI